MLELPSEFRQFDYSTIPDVVLHLRYTARQGGAQLREKAVEHVQELVEDANASGLLQLFSLKHDFSSEWHSFVIGDENQKLKLTVRKEHFPYFVQGRNLVIDKVELYAIQGDRLLPPVTPSGVDASDLTADLKDNKEFEISLAPDNKGLVRESGALVFLLFRYSLD
jgi:hypothetical protein